MNKLLSISLVVLFIAAFFSGCVESYNREITITWSNTDFTIDKGTDLLLKIHGRENTITIDKQVSLELIEFGMGSENNSIWIHGQPKTNETSTWEPHNCKISGDSLEYGNVINYRGE